MSKNIHLTIDIEEWYHLDYLKNYDINKHAVETIPQMIEFLDLLDRLNIKATFFTLGEIAKQNADILKEIHYRGHEIGCHGMDHDLLYNKTTAEFKDQIIEARHLVNEIIGEDVVRGYRASCFSMDREKLDVLKGCGYDYDSSYITFAEHPLYGKLDLEGYTKIDDLVYSNNNFLEFEIPTLAISKYNIPISGGGYLRLFPYGLNKLLIKKYLSENNNFIFYLHPFELTNMKLPFDSQISNKDKFRAQVGRNSNLKKLEKILKMLLNNGANFSTLGQRYNHYVKKEVEHV